jgi:putative transposase
MRDRAASGLSIRAYCKQAGIHENNYYYWQKKLREAAVKTHAQEHKPQRYQTHQEVKEVPSGWALCEAKKSTKHENIEQSPLIISIGHYRVEVSPETDMEHLANVCRLLASIC